MARRKESNDNRIRRWLSNQMNKNAFVDFRKKETVNTTEADTLRREAEKRFGAIDPRLWERLVNGLILADSRGEGYLQQVGDGEILNDNIGRII